MIRSFSTNGLTIILLLVCVLALKLYWLFFTDLGSTRLVLDEYTNLDYANSIKNSISYFAKDGVAYRPPAYSFFLAIVKICVGNKIVYYKIANILLSLGTIFLVYSSLPATRRIFGGLLIACYPPYFLLYELVLAENFSIFLVALTIKIFTIYQRHASLRNILAFGITNAALALTRPESIIFIFLSLLVLVKKNQKVWIAIGIVFMAIQAWMVRNYFALGAYPVFSTNATNTFYLATFPESTGTSIYADDDLAPFPTFNKDLVQTRGMSEIQVYNFYRTKGWQYLAENPLLFVARLPTRVFHLLAPEHLTAARLIRADRYHIQPVHYSFYFYAAIAWDLIVWGLLLTAILRRGIDFYYVTYLLGLVLTVCFVIAEPRFKMQIMPALIVGSIVAIDKKRDVNLNVT